MNRRSPTAWIASLLLSVTSAAGQSAHVESAVDAISIASKVEEIREQLGDEDSLRVTARFVDEWEAWMVEFYEDDGRLAFVTINREGQILEVGPDGEVDDRDIRIQELREELETARSTGNEAEVREITALLSELGGLEDNRPIDVDALLESFHALGGYDMSILRWEPCREGAIQVEMRIGDTPWAPRVKAAASEGTWIDENAASGAAYSYRIRFIGKDGGSSRPSRAFRLTPKALSDSPLPVYALTLPDEGRRRMLDDVTDEISVEGAMRIQEADYPVRVRLRGASTRHAQKKSYRVQFLDTTPIGRKVTYLKAEAMDHTMQQEKLSCDIFRAAGAHCSAAEYVNLTINGRYEGVYLDIEPVRAPFKRNEGLDPKGTLIRASTFQHVHEGDSLGDLRGDEGSLGELRAFLTKVSRVERGAFEKFIRQETDWPKLRDYLALQVVCHRSEIEADDYLLYRAPDSGKWWLIPRDHNNGNFNVLAFRNQIGDPYMHPYWQTIQQLGWRPSYWFVLPSRVYNNRTLQLEYLDRLEQLTRELVLSGEVARLIEKNHAQIEGEYTIDPYRKPYGRRDPFLRAEEDLKKFMRMHAERLLGQIDQARRPGEEQLVINEFAFTGKDSGWVELSNRGEKAIPLQDFALATKNAAGNWSIPLLNESPLGAGALTVLPFGDGHPWQFQGESDNEQTKRSGSSALSRTGGFLALVRQHSEGDRGEDEAQDEEVVDFYFFGEQVKGSSYGRLRDRCAKLRPTPGAENIAR